MCLSDSTNCSSLPPHGFRASAPAYPHHNPAVAYYSYTAATHTVKPTPRYVRTQHPFSQPPLRWATDPRMRSTQRTSFTNTNRTHARAAVSEAEIEVANTLAKMQSQRPRTPQKRRMPQAPIHATRVAGKTARPTYRFPLCAIPETNYHGPISQAPSVYRPIPAAVHPFHTKHTYQHQHQHQHQRAARTGLEGLREAAFLTEKPFIREAAIAELNIRAERTAGRTINVDAMHAYAQNTATTLRNTHKMTPRHHHHGTRTAQSKEKALVITLRRPASSPAAGKAVTPKRQKTSKALKKFATKLPSRPSLVKAKSKTTSLSCAKQAGTDVQCKVCNKFYAHAGNLKRHMVTHTGEKKFKCQHHNCERTFNQRSHLQTHEITHSGERKFECDQCDAKFGQKGHLKGHMQSKHGIV